MQLPYGALYRWYRAYGRHTLPWRRTDDPYRIYLSEVMLQQTQVKTVLERYYEPFLKRFPTLKDVAEAPLEEVLKLWQGLGYYTRAKNLHKTACLSPVLPDNPTALQKLPGIGKNTAYAICAFAYKQPLPVMEANLKRLICRLFALEDPKSAKLWELAHRLLDRAHPFEYNQAMMDLGALVCTPTSPSCEACPFEGVCQGKDNPTRYPRKIKRNRPLKRHIVVLEETGKKLALKQYKGRFLHGLWGFEVFESTPKDVCFIGSVQHVYTHFKLHCEVYVRPDTSPKTNQNYFTLEQIARLPLSKVDEKILALYLRHKG